MVIELSSVLITGGNGVLGSSLAREFLHKGSNVTVSEIVRKDESWRLAELNVLDEVKYLWKSSLDLRTEDLKGVDLVIDAAIGFPDRPFCIESPKSAMEMNIGPALGLLESVRHLDRKPLLIYPSSFNSLYGNSGSYTESTPSNPASIYGWTKASVEQLYWAYHRSYGVPIIITRVGSGFGEMMRTDELVAKLILSAIRRQRFVMKSPNSSRMWTYLKDVVNAYLRIAEICDYGRSLEFAETLDTKGEVINVAGNLSDKIVKNLELAEIIKGITGGYPEVVPSNEYEPGELLNDVPINFGFNGEASRTLLGWSPMFTLEEGLAKTFEWFSDHRAITEKNGDGKE